MSNIPLCTCATSSLPIHLIDIILCNTNTACKLHTVIICFKNKEMRSYCYREEPNLTPCWICFLYFNLYFPLLLFTERLLSIYNGLPRGTLPLCLNGKLKCLCSGKHPDPVHLWMAARKKTLTHPLPEAGHSWGHLQNLWPFHFTSSSPPPLCAIKETGTQTTIRWFSGDISLPSSWSAGFPNKVVFLASTPFLQFIGLS